MGLDLVSVVLIFATLGLLLAGWYRWESDGPAKSRKDAWPIRFPLSLFAGWVSAAAFVNLSATSKLYGFTGGLGEIGLGCVLLTLCAVVALTICRTMLHVTFYAAAVLWAMVGILAAAPPVWVGLTAALIAIAVLTSFSGRESRNREFTTSGKDSRLRVG